MGDMVSKGLGLNTEDLNIQFFDSDSSIINKNLVPTFVFPKELAKKPDIETRIVNRRGTPLLQNIVISIVQFFREAPN